ncbi:MAG TPA: AAA family ATPase [Streptosporangiaceae bacterium]|nr:AAA family ATPase [Streptosporangiaceae bacterium]
MCGSPTAASVTPREARKNVAILFMDLVGSTALAEMLDPEPLRQIMDRYFAAASASIEAHGGAVEKYIGDAVMAVFGATVSHEDDALRAVLAAREAVEKVSELSAGLATSHKITLEVRCGICSGEVMAITTAGDFRVIGDAVNTAARLQTAAEAGEILVDAASASMIRTAVGLDPVEPLTLKGKSQPVPAWRVTSGELPGDPTGAPPPTPLIGREDELDDLKSAFRRVTKRNQLCLVTVLGAPGIGKTRLVRDFIGTLKPADATVLTGKCSAYGRGITYKPLAEMLGTIGGGWDDRFALMQAGSSEARRAADCLAGIAEDRAVPTGTEEISWAVRYLLSELGKSKPVIMVWEDLHWAESTLLDMIDDVVSWLTDVPVLLLCLSRMELLDTRPSWGGGKPCAMTVEVGPLTREESAQLCAGIAMREDVYAHSQDMLCERVADQCEGNPLFAELLLDVFADSAPGSSLPPTISALLTSRLDQLPQDERQLLEVASAIGRDFSWTVLRAMLAAENVGDSHAQEILSRLAKRRIVSRIDGDSFRFGQALMRDTVYALSPKTRRERWHLLLADHFAQVCSDAEGSAQDERMVLAYHVETAGTLARELRPGDSRLPAHAPQAARVLIAEGTKALHRQDLPGAAALLERGRSLAAADDERQIALMLYISDCWHLLSDAGRALAAIDACPAKADPVGSLVCQIQRCMLELRLELAAREQIVARADQLAMEVRHADDARQVVDRAWCRLHQLKAHLHLGTEQTARAEAELWLALDRARVLQDNYETDRLLAAICELAQWAPTTVSAGLKVCAELSERFAANRAALVSVLLTKARLAALGGDLNGARAALAAAKAHTSDLHLNVADAVIMGVTALVDALAGDHRLAETSYRRCQRLLIDVGLAGESIVYEAYAARELFEQGKVADAERALRLLTETAPGMDLRTEVIVNALNARIAAVTGRAALALELAEGAAARSEQTDDLCLQGDCYTDLAIVAAQAGQQAEAAEAAAIALDRYQAKGAARLIMRAQRLLGAVGDRQNRDAP